MSVSRRDTFLEGVLWSSSVRAFGQINHIVNNGTTTCLGCTNADPHDDHTLYVAGFTYDKMLHTMPDDVYDVIMKIHVRAPFRLVRAAAPYFRVKVCRLHNSTSNPIGTRYPLFSRAERR